MDSWPFNFTDLAVLFIVLLSALLAFARGFVHEVLSIAGWVGAIFATIYGFPYVKPFARDLISWKFVADIAAGTVIFIVSLIVLSIITRAAAKQVRGSALNALDRALGFLFGILRGAVVVCLIYIGIEMIWSPKEQPNWLRGAKSITAVEYGAALLKLLVPKETVQKSTEAAKDTADKARKMLETQRVLREMIAPEPKSAPKNAPEGYKAKERRDMNRLIEGNQ
ncbi:MAG: CvpA family protein [Rhodospirillales bacterium]